MITPTEDNIKTVTDIRENIIGILAAIKQKDEPTYIFHRSRLEGVLLSPLAYNKLQELLEDYYDALDALELERNPEEGGYPLEEVAKELGVTLSSPKKVKKSKKK